MRPCAWILVVLLAGCAADGGGKSQATDMNVPGVPSPLTIELRALSKDGRSTYHRLRPDGTLEFGGGASAIGRTSQPYGKVTPDQLKRIWSVIEKHKLLENKGKFSAKAEKVSYEARLTAGLDKVSYNAVDQEVPGLDELDQILFKMQAEMRYKDVFTPADEKLRQQRERQEAEKAKTP